MPNSWGMHSAWIGEHHFSTLGVLSCPDVTLHLAIAGFRGSLLI
jgi:hypothetical protein